MISDEHQFQSVQCVSSIFIIFSLYFISFFLQYCVLSPVKWSDLRKSKSMDPDLHHLHRPSAVGGAYQPELLSSGLLSSSSSLSSFSDAGSRTPRVSDLLLFPRPVT